MNFQQEIEKLLPDEDHWEWHEGARYRIKQAKDSVWFGLRVFQEGDQIKAKPIIAYKNKRVKVIKSNTPFLPIDKAMEQLEITKDNAMEEANSPKSPSNPIYLK